jgi:hypothetical protein
MEGGGEGMKNPFAGFVPWIIFWVVAGPSTWEWATLGALLAAVILAVPSAERGSLKSLDVGSIAFFGVLSLLAIFLDRDQLDWVEDYSQVISSGVLAVIALGSLLMTPFTEEYARESAPREVWDSPAFKRTNVVLTAMWGAVFAVNALVGLIAQETDSATAREWLNWIIPIVLVVGAFKFTAWYAEQARARATTRAAARAA